MSSLTSQEDKAVRLFKNNLTEIFSERLISVNLFGSKARGDSHPDSDIDLLVIIDKKTWEDEQKVYSSVTDVFLATGIYVSPKIYDPQKAKEKRHSHNVFFQEVDKDSIVV